MIRTPDPLLRRQVLYPAELRAHKEKSRFGIFSRRNARGRTSACSAAKASLDAISSLFRPTKPDNWFSMGVYSKGNPYGIDENLVFSFPCRLRRAGDIEIVPNLTIDSFLKEKLALTQKELIDERAMVAHLLKG